ncbi:MAG TPA: hypothetical protein PK523_07940, partial [Elusimicrobiales bacterium]|nr:hypothetical protein [Elusimicrobiales bacterium]
PLNAATLDITVTPIQATTTLKIEAFDASGAEPGLSTGTAAGIMVDPSGGSQLHIVMDDGSGLGELLEQGSAAGVAGSPRAVVAGSRIPLKVYLTDVYYNLVPASTAAVRLESADADDYGVVSSTREIIAGVASWTDANGPIVFNARPQAKLKAYLVDPFTGAPLASPPAYSADQESSTFTVNAGSFARLILRFSEQVHRPGQPDDPADPLGPNGFSCAFNLNRCGKDPGFGINAKTAGLNYQAEVIAADFYYNKVSTDAAVTMLPSGAPNITNETVETWPVQTLQAGATVYNFSFTVADSPRYITPRHQLDQITGYRSGNVTVGPEATPKKLVLLMPGECLAPGSATGKYGSPDGNGLADEDVDGCPTGKGDGVQPFTAGTPVRYKVKLTDSFHNRRSNNGGDDLALRIVSDDPYDSASDPRVGPLVVIPNGGATFDSTPGNDWTLVTATGPAPSGGWRLTATKESGSACPGCSSSVTSKLPVDPGAPVKLQVLAPGELAAPGSADGKNMSYSPSVSTAGARFNFTVRLVDANWNLVPLNNVPVTLGVRGDPYAVFTGGPNLTIMGGTADKEVELRRAQTGGNYAVIEATATGYTSALYSPASRDIGVLHSTPTRLQVLMPGQAADPGSASGKSGAVSVSTAGISFPVTVRATDDYWNICADTSATVNLSTAPGSDPYAAGTGLAQPLTAGATVFQVTFYRGEGTSSAVRASTTGPNSLLSSLSDAAVVNSSSPAKLLVLLPSESADPGRPPYDRGSEGGRTAASYSPTAGTPFALRVYAVDEYWNRLTAVAADVRGRSADPNDNEAGFSIRPLFTGTTNFNAVLVTTGSWQVTVSTNSGAALSDGVSRAAAVTAGAVNRLVVLLPGETLSPGTSDYTAGYVPGGAPANLWGGKTSRQYSDLADWTAGVPETVRVYATDAWFNPVADVRDVTLSADDPNAAPVLQPLENGTTSFTLPLYTAVVSTGTRRSFTVSATGLANNTYRTPDFLLLPNVPTSLRLLAPGQQRAPGTAAGRSGPPDPQTAGIPFDVTVDVTDNWGNLVSSEPVARVYTPDDLYDAIGDV